MIGVTVVPGVRVEDLPDLPVERLEAEVSQLAADLAAASCRWLLLIAELDRRKAYEAWGMVSCARWLAWRCGVASSTAHEHVRVARQLPALPHITSAFAAGELSYAKVRALTRFATPEAEHDLVGVARHTTAAQLDRIAHAYLQASGAAPRRQVERYARWYWDDDGNLHLRACLPADEGAAVVAALEAARTAVDAVSAPTPDSPAEDTQPPVNSDSSAAGSRPPTSPDSSAEESAGAIAFVVPDDELDADDRFWDDQLAAATVTTEGTDSWPDPHDPNQVPARTWRAEREPGHHERTNADALVMLAETLLAYGPTDHPDLHQVLIHADASVLAPGGQRHTGCWFPPAAVLAGGPALNPATARRLACDARLTAVHHAARHLVDPDATGFTGVSRRLPTARQRRALLARDRHCRFPGCTTRLRLRAHHIRFWSQGGATVLANLLLLCNRHHHAVHEGGFTVTGTAGDPRFTRPDGTPVVPGRPPTGVHDLHAEQRRTIGLTTTPSTCHSLGYGERFDLALTVDALTGLLQPPPHRN